MEVRDRLGELLLVGFQGQEMNRSLAAHIRRLRPAGLIFFSRNIATPEQLARLSRDVQTLALGEFGRPLFLAVDQEGGTVARLSSPFTQLPNALTLGNSGCESANRYYDITANELRVAGLNLNFAPVLDIDHPDSAGLMESRSFGSIPSLVTRCGVAAINATQGNGIMATAKHFPGLGRARIDPHHDLPIVTASSEELHQHDLLPFQAAVHAGVACVMTSHTLYTSLDPALPATFSPAILRGLLREKLGFDGVVITDDLEMGAVGRRYSTEDAAIEALKAGADLLLVCNDMEKMQITAEAIALGFDRGLLDSESLARSLVRLDRLRDQYLHGLSLANPDGMASYFST
jgi:beta-N-acetylhexosaminidase